MTAADIASTHRRSLDSPEEFWAEAAAAIEWVKPWDTVLDADASPAARWFVGGELNTCYNALDRHADGGRGDQPALIYDSAVTASSTTYTYSELRDQVALFAGVLARAGVDRDTIVSSRGRIAFAVGSVLSDLEVVERIEVEARP